MTKEIFNLMDCPRDCEGCVGLFVSANGSAIEIEQSNGGYTVMTREGKPGHGNCTHYEECYAEMMSQKASVRKPAELTFSYSVLRNQETGKMFDKFRKDVREAQEKLDVGRRRAKIIVEEERKRMIIHNK